MIINIQSTQYNSDGIYDKDCINPNCGSRTDPGSVWSVSGMSGSVSGSVSGSGYTDPVIRQWIRRYNFDGSVSVGSADPLTDPLTDTGSVWSVGSHGSSDPSVDPSCDGSTNGSTLVQFFPDLENFSSKITTQENLWIWYDGNQITHLEKSMKKT